MKKSIGFLSAVVLSVAAVGCSDSMSPAAPSAASMTEEAKAASPANVNSRAAQPTIAAIAVGNPSFSTLVLALQKAGLVETFAGTDQYTVFAPTNAAFDAAASALGFAGGPQLIAALTKEQLTTVLLYHVAKGDRRAQGVVSSGQVLMLDGNRASVTVEGQTAKIDGATIEATDIVASNGIVHVIGGVLLPPGFLASLGL